MIRMITDFLSKNNARQKTVKKQELDLSSSLKQQKQTKTDRMSDTMVFQTMDIKNEKQ